MAHPRPSRRARCLYYVSITEAAVTVSIDDPKGTTLTSDPLSNFKLLRGALLPDVSSMFRASKASRTQCLLWALAISGTGEVEGGGNVEETTTVVDGDEEVGEDKREDSHELHHNVEGWAGGILKRVTDSVTDNGGLVDLGLLGLDNVDLLVEHVSVLRVLGSEVLGDEGADGDVSTLDVLLGVIPSTTGVGLGDGKLDGGDEGTDEEARDSLDTEKGTSGNRGDHDKHGRGNHLLEGSLGGDVNTLLVVRLHLAIVDILAILATVSVELVLDVLDHGSSGHTNGLHAVSSEPVWKHGAEEEEGEGDWAEHVNNDWDGAAGRTVDRRVSREAGHETTEEGEGDESSGANGEALTDGGGGVTGGVESISLVADELWELSHLSETTGVIGDWSVDIDGETSGKCSEHTKGGEGNTVHADEGESNVDVEGKEGDWEDARKVSKGKTVDDVGGGTRLT